MSENPYLARMKINILLAPLRRNIDLLCRKLDAGELGAADNAALRTAVRLIQADRPSVADIAAATGVIGTLADAHRE